MRHYYRFYCTSTEFYEQMGVVLTHEIVSLSQVPVTRGNEDEPPRVSHRKNGIFEPTDFWMGR
jgi:hypothetical protein